MADGAAFNPGTGTWRPITDSPVPFEWARGVVIGGAVYLWIPGAPGRPNAPRAFLAYRIGPDRWQELPLPPAALERDYTIAGAGGRVVAYTGSDEGGEHPDFVFDPAAASWTELSPDPLSPSFDRSMAWSGRELILFDHELIANPGSERPALTRAAALDLESGTWRRLPDSEILATGPWVRADGHLVNPTLGGTDGGETNNWGRTYFYGGILDPGRGAWLPLPNPPPDQDVPSAGVRTDSGADYFGASGWVFDAATNSWTLIPPPDTDGVLTGQTVVAAGRDLFVFGGARWNSDHSSGKLLRDAWIWSPESARVVR